MQILDDANDITMLKTINDLNAVLKPEDNVLIYYAGHGTRLKSGQLESGYWLPVNADAPPEDRFWIPNEQITGHLGRLNAKRVLVVADSCYSGLLSTDPSYLFLNDKVAYSKEYIKFKLPKRSRLLLSSGGDKPVLDEGSGGNSVFARAFLDELEANQGILSSPELFSRIRKRVEGVGGEEQVRADAGVQVDQGRGPRSRRLLLRAAKQVRLLTRSRCGSGFSLTAHRSRARLSLVAIAACCRSCCGALAALAGRCSRLGARAELGIPFDGTPGPLNAITDVAPVAVGYTTLIDGAGEHAVRTGVTAILPRGRATLDKPVFAGVFSLNGNGEMTGTHWIEESGFLEGPVMITGTHSVGTVRDAVIAWRIKQGKPDASGYWWSLPVVAETWDGDLSDANGFHVKAEHVFAALEGARGGALAEGNVGGGTAMICHEFKCGTGTSSRVVEIAGQRYTVGVLVQANYGVRSELRIAGVPVGKFMPVTRAGVAGPGIDHHRRRDRRAAPAAATEATGTARVARTRAQRQLFRRRIGRPVPRVLDGERRSEPDRELRAARARQRPAQSAVSRHGAERGGEHRQRDGRCRNHDRPERHDRAGDRYRRAEEDPEALRSAAALTELSPRARQSTTKRAPPSGDRSTCAVPPCHSTIRLTIASPRPKPVFSPAGRPSCTNEPNTRSRSASAMPGPSSSTHRR